MIELTENLLYKLEEKMMLLLAETEGLRSETEGLRQQVQRLQQDNIILRQEKDELRQEKEDNTQRLRNLVALLDSVNPVAQAPVISPFMSVKPELVQVQEAQG